MGCGNNWRFSNRSQSAIRKSRQQATTRIPAAKVRNTWVALREKRPAVLRLAFVTRINLQNQPAKTYHYHQTIQPSGAPRRSLRKDEEDGLNEGLFN